MVSTTVILMLGFHIHVRTNGEYPTVWLFGWCDSCYRFVGRLIFRADALKNLLFASTHGG